ncbi:hypothetical protein Bca4012_097642 [Brassica carinata]
MYLFPVKHHHFQFGFRSELTEGFDDSGLGSSSLLLGWSSLWAGFVGFSAVVMSSPVGFRFR